MTHRLSKHSSRYCYICCCCPGSATQLIVVEWLLGCYSYNPHNWELYILFSSCKCILFLWNIPSQLSSDELLDDLCANVQWKSFVVYPPEEHLRNSYEKGLMMLLCCSGWWIAADEIVAESWFITILNDAILTLFLYFHFLIYMYQAEKCHFFRNM